MPIVGQIQTWVVWLVGPVPSEALATKGLGRQFEL